MIEKSRVKLRKNWNIKEKKTEKKQNELFFILFSTGQQWTKV